MFIISWQVGGRIKGRALYIERPKCSIFALLVMFDICVVISVLQDLLDLEEEEKEEGSAEDSSEYEEYTDSEEEDAEPRLKPVFVRK